MACPDVKHQTAAQFVGRLKARFKAAEKYEKARLANKLYQWYSEGCITQTQIRNAFDLDTTEKWTAFRDRLIALREHYLAIDAEVAE